MTEPSPIPFPNAFRRRLIVIFITMVGLSTGLVAMGSFLIVSKQRHDLFMDRSIAQARVLYKLTANEDSAPRLEQLVTAVRERQGLETMVVADQTISSLDGMQPRLLPSELEEVTGPDIQTASIEFNGEPYFVVGKEIVANPPTRLFLLTNGQYLESELNELRNVLLGGWLGTTAIAALVGGLFARQTLRPIRNAADAARSLTEGMLDTRLPETGRDEFNAWARSFNEMAAALETKIGELSASNAREQRFTADVAHDLRTPVASIVSAISLLSSRSNDLNPESARLVQLLEGDIGRLRKLIADLLELGRLQTAGEISVAEPVSLSAQVQRVVEPLAREHQILVEVPSVIVNIDRVRFERVLANLVLNACVHGRESISVVAIATDTSVRMEVSDKGPGIPADEIDTIFDRFHKVSRARTGDGSGLGLAIAAEHVRLMGGSISAENSVGGGAVFRFDVPIVLDASSSTDEEDNDNEKAASH